MATTTRAVQLTLPDGSERTVPAGHHAARGRGVDRPAAGQGRGGRRARRRAGRPAPAAGAGGRLPHPHRQEPGGRRRSSATRAEHVLADAVKRLWPEAELRRRTQGPQREVPVRLPLPARLHSRGPRGDRGRDARDPRRGRGVRARRGLAARTPERSSAKMGERSRSSGCATFPEGETITLYRHGRFVDLCRGPHVQNAGADRRRQAARGLRRLLQGRRDERAAAAHLRHRLRLREGARRRTRSRWKQARARDHRRLGQELDLFSFNPLAPASPFLHPKGAFVYNALIDYVRELNAALRLRRGDHAADPRRRALEHLGALRQLPREHVLHRGGRARSSRSSR